MNEVEKTVNELKKKTWKSIDLKYQTERLIKLAYKGAQRITSTDEKKAQDFINIIIKDTQNASKHIKWEWHLKAPTPVPPPVPTPGPIEEGDAYEELAKWTEQWSKQNMRDNSWINTADLETYLEEAKKSFVPVYLDKKELYTDAVKKYLQKKTTKEQLGTALKINAQLIRKLWIESEAGLKNTIFNTALIPIARKVRKNNPEATGTVEYYDAIYAEIVKWLQNNNLAEAAAKANIDVVWVTDMLRLIEKDASNKTPKKKDEPEPVEVEEKDFLDWTNKWSKERVKKNDWIEEGDFEHYLEQLKNDLGKRTLLEEQGKNPETVKQFLEGRTTVEQVAVALKLDPDSIKVSWKASRAGIMNQLYILLTGFYKKYKPVMAKDIAPTAHFESERYYQYAWTVVNKHLEQHSLVAAANIAHINQEWVKKTLDNISGKKGYGPLKEQKISSEENTNKIKIIVKELSERILQTKDWISQGQLPSFISILKLDQLREYLEKTRGADKAQEEIRSSDLEVYKEEFGIQPEDIKEAWNMYMGIKIAMYTYIQEWVKEHRLEEVDKGGFAKAIDHLEEFVKNKLKKNGYGSLISKEGVDRQFIIDMYTDITGNKP